MGRRKKSWMESESFLKQSFAVYGRFWVAHLVTVLTFIGLVLVGSFIGDIASSL